MKSAGETPEKEDTPKEPSVSERMRFKAAMLGDSFTPE